MVPGLSLSCSVCLRPFFLSIWEQSLWKSLRTVKQFCGNSSFECDAHIFSSWQICNPNCFGNWLFWKKNFLCKLVGIHRVFEDHLPFDFVWWLQITLKTVDGLCKRHFHIKLLNNLVLCTCFKQKILKSLGKVKLKKVIHLVASNNNFYTLVCVVARSSYCSLPSFV